MTYKSRGFIQTGGLLKAKIRAATETRGFAETRLLTNWMDIAGPSTANICRPVKVSYGKQGFGATLTLLTTGANAPVLQMQLPKIISKVNSTYGYNAISKIKITQTSPVDFKDTIKSSEGKNIKAPSAVSPSIIYFSDISEMCFLTAIFIWAVACFAA